MDLDTDVVMDPGNAGENASPVHNAGGAQGAPSVQILFDRAVKIGNTTDAQALLKKGADVNAVTSNGSIPLHNAIIFPPRPIDMIDVLLKFDANTELRDDSSQTALHLAINKGIGLEAIKLLLQNGANPNLADQDGCISLHLAAARTPPYSEKLVELLLHHDADPWIMNKERRLPIQCAAQRDEQRGVVKLLVEFDLVSNTVDKHGKSALFYAAQLGTTGIFEAPPKKRQVYNLRAKNNYGIVDRFGRTALHYAAMCNWELRYLVGHNLDINAKDRCLMAPLHYATYWPNYKAVCDLLDAGAQVKTTSNTGKTPLHYAAAHASARPIVERLIGLGANVNAIDEKAGKTPLHYAAHNADVIKCLGQAGARVKLSDKMNRSALHYAVQQNDIQAVYQVMQLGPTVNLKDNDGRTALHDAAYAGATDIVFHLISQGARMDIVDDHQRTALHEAASRGSRETISALIQNGASIETKGAQGRTALHEAARADSLESISLLLEAGANIAARGLEGETALHVAAISGSHQAISVLLQRGADIESTDSAGKTALHFAVAQSALPAVQVLLDQGANINAKDSLGVTTFCHALFFGTSSNARELATRGADKEGLVEAFNKIHPNMFATAEMNPLNYRWLQHMLFRKMFRGYGNDTPSITIIEWSIPQAVRYLLPHDPAPIQGGNGLLPAQNIAELGNAMVFSGSDNRYEANTLRGSLRELYGHAGTDALADIESVLLNFGQPLGATLSTREFMIMATEHHLIFGKRFPAENAAHERKRDEAIRWLCQSVRLKAYLERGMWISPEPIKRTSGEFCNIYVLPNIERFNTNNLPTGNNWMRAIPVGLIVKCKIDRPWGNGLKMPCHLMAMMVGADRLALADGLKSRTGNKQGYFLRGNYSAAIPVARCRNSKKSGIQWHLLIDPAQERRFTLEDLQPEPWMSINDLYLLENSECYLD